MKKTAKAPLVELCSCGDKPKHAKFKTARGESRPFYSKAEGRGLLTTLIQMKYIPKTHRNSLLMAIGTLALPETSKRKGKTTEEPDMIILIVVSSGAGGKGDPRGH